MSHPNPSDPPTDRDEAVAAVALYLVSLAARRAPQAVQTRGRAANMVAPRHLVLYLLHVGLGWPLERVGAVGARSRSTVSHACRQVEAWRDRARFDEDLTELEDVMRRAAALRLELPS